MLIWIQILNLIVFNLEIIIKHVKRQKSPFPMFIFKLKQKQNSDTSHRYRKNFLQLLIMSLTASLCC